MDKKLIVTGLLVSGLLLSGSVLAKENNRPSPLANLKETREQLEKAKEKIRDNDIDEEIEDIQTEQEEVDRNIEAPLQKMSSRSGVIKLIVGPDYKNAGQVRSEIVKLENQIRKLNKIETKLPEADKPVIESAIASLSAELSIIQTRLSTALSGFSLFGWWGRFITKYTPTVTPTPTAIPTVFVTSPTPSPSPVPTLEVVTPTP